MLSIGNLFDTIKAFIEKGWYVFLIAQLVRCWTAIPRVGDSNPCVGYPPFCDIEISNQHCYLLFEGTSCYAESFDVPVCVWGIKFANPIY